MSEDDKNKHNVFLYILLAGINDKTKYLKPYPKNSSGYY